MRSSVGISALPFKYFSMIAPSSGWRSSFSEGMVTMPSEAELNSPEVGELIRKYLKGRAEISTEDRMRVLRLIENMTLGRNAVGYLTESMHGAGSPQAQRIQISRAMQIEFKKCLAKTLAGIAPESSEEPGDDPAQYMARVFKPVGTPDSTV